jgi:hypothetical protein
MTDDELDLVETDQLVEALHRRFDCVVLGTVTHLNTDQEERGIYWRGGFIAAVGLVWFIDKRFTAKILEREAEDEEET